MASDQGRCKCSMKLIIHRFINSTLQNLIVSDDLTRLSHQISAFSFTLIMYMNNPSYALVVLYYRCKLRNREGIGTQRHPIHKKAQFLVVTKEAH